MSSDPSIVDQAIATLQASGVTLAPGHTDAQLSAAETRFGFRFAPVHRDFLLRVRPQGKGWCDWTDLDDPKLAFSLEGPIDGVLFDVEYNEFWPPSWGPRPDLVVDQQTIARLQFASWPKLVPIFGHRYMPDAASGCEFVISVVQTDVIVYGDNLADYVRNEFVKPPGPLRTQVSPDMLPPWTLFCFCEDVP